MKDNLLKRLQEARPMTHQDIIHALTGQAPPKRSQKTADKKGVFQPPTPEDIKQRTGKVSIAGVLATKKDIDLLKKTFGDNDAVVAAAVAYGDSAIFDPKTGKQVRIESDCDTDWPGVYTDYKTLLLQIEAVLTKEGGYNDFDMTCVEALHNICGDQVEYRFAREGSVAIYVKPVTPEMYRQLKRSKPYEEGVGAAEVFKEGKDEVRLWWD